jgi:hypothetical protein
MMAGFGIHSQTEFASEEECAAYDREFRVGEQQRAEADAWGGSPPKKRR